MLSLRQSRPPMVPACPCPHWKCGTHTYIGLHAFQPGQMLTIQALPSWWIVQYPFPDSQNLRGDITLAPLPNKWSLIIWHWWCLYFALPSQACDSSKGHMLTHGLSALPPLAVASLFSGENVFHSSARWMPALSPRPPSCVRKLPCPTLHACTNLTSLPLSPSHTGKGTYRAWCFDLGSSNLWVWIKPWSSQTTMDGQFGRLQGKSRMLLLFQKLQCTVLMTNAQFADLNVDLDFDWGSWHSRSSGLPWLGFLLGPKACRGFIYSIRLPVY